MTVRKPLDELKRPNRAFGELLRAGLCCPFCRGEVRVVAYRYRSTRLECVHEDCGERFTIARGELKPGIDRDTLDKYVLFARMVRPPRGRA